MISVSPEVVDSLCVINHFEPVGVTLQIIVVSGSDLRRKKLAILSFDDMLE